MNRSSYYAWLKRPLPKSEKENLKLTEQLRKIHKESQGTYGAPRLTARLQKDGLRCSRKRVAKLMRKVGLFGCAKRKSRWVPTTTDSSHGLYASPRLFKIEDKTQFPKAPNQVWVSDTTYIPTSEGWLYLTIQLDIFTRKIVGYCMSEFLKSEAVWESMKRALQKQKQALSVDEPKLIAHSDRGRQYASQIYRGPLERLGITQSMSRSGNCYDNSYAETFFHTLKVELVYRQDFRTRNEAERAIQIYIEEWYNPKRIHSGLGYQAPIDYERHALAA